MRLCDRERDELCPLSVGIGRGLVCFLFLFLLHLGVIGAPIRAVTIAYEAIHLSGHRWEYRYHVSGHSFPLDEGFVVYFSIDAEFLQDPAPHVPGWHIEIIQPDPGLAADGWYDAVSLVNLGAALPDFFSIQFDWNVDDDPAVGDPGEQFFEVYHLPVVSPPSDSGMTIPYQAQGVPDGGGTLGLLLLGASGLLVGSRRWVGSRG